MSKKDMSGPEYYFVEPDNSHYIPSYNIHGLEDSTSSNSIVTHIGKSIHTPSRELAQI